jgi:transcriptional regulator with XRE-family HTH domain
MAHQENPSSKLSLQTFITLINARREELNLTQEQLAEIAGLDSRHLQKLLAGDLDPRFTTMTSVASALGIKSIQISNDLDDENLDLSNTGIFYPSFTQIRQLIRNEDSLLRIYLTPEGLSNAILYAYSIIGSIDFRLAEAGVEKLGGGMVELANYSSMIGNLLAAGISKFSGGSYRQNGPHKYPDLLPAGDNPLDGIEIKMGLENNKPKGHLAKSGLYLTFRYVLTRDGVYVKGKENRGDTAVIWEARLGYLSESDFSISNTDGDSGKTAVIMTEALKKMKLVYFDELLCPISRYDVYKN